MKLKRIKLFEEFVKEAEVKTEDPLALAILGAPAGGKSYSKNLLTKIEYLTKVAKVANPNFSKDLTVDILRGEIQKLPDDRQIELFYWGYYTLRDLANDHEYSKWFSDITDLWEGKLKDLLSKKGIDVVIEDEDIMLNGKIGKDAIEIINNTNLKGLVDDLDNYKDYKRVVRAYQQTLQKRAMDNKDDIVYDETGDEPDKIIKNMAQLDKKNYVTDVIMVHHKNVINNLFQNAYRMVVGGDGGRDSSEAIVQTYKNIKAGLDKYKNAAEVSVVTSTAELQKGRGKAIDALSQANTQDDEEMGNKPIDVFVRIYGEDPKNVLKRVLDKLDDEQERVLKAIVVFQVQDPEVGALDKTRDLALRLIDMNNAEVLDTLEKANKGELKNNYVHKHGGVTDKLVKKAKEVL